MDPGAPRRPRQRVGWGVATVVLLCCAGGPVGAVLWLDKRLSPRDGRDIAREEIRYAAGQVRGQLTDPRRPRDAETLASSLTPSVQGQGWVVRIEPLAWAGRVQGNEVASIDVRFVATVEREDSAAIGASGHSAGSATECYRYRLQLYRDTTATTIDCPDLPHPPVPSPEFIPTLPRDAEARLTTVLQQSTAETLAADVRQAFPEPYLTVDTAAQDGELVAAVGVPQERDCLVGVRGTDGTVFFAAFRRPWLEPGEIGCKVALYTAPPR